MARATNPASVENQYDDESASSSQSGEEEHLSQRGRLAEFATTALCQRMALDRLDNCPSQKSECCMVFSMHCMQKLSASFDISAYHEEPMHPSRFRDLV